MKKVFLGLVIAASFIACNNSGTETPATTDSPKVETPVVDSPKVETPAADSPKMETPKMDSPKVAAPEKMDAKKEETAK